MKPVSPAHNLRDFFHCMLYVDWVVDKAVRTNR